MCEIDGTRNLRERIKKSWSVKKLLEKIGGAEFAPCALERLHRPTSCCVKYSGAIQTAVYIYFPDRLTQRMAYADTRQRQPISEAEHDNSLIWQLFYPPPRKRGAGRRGGWATPKT